MLCISSKIYSFINDSLLAYVFYLHVLICPGLYSTGRTQDFNVFENVLLACALLLVSLDCG